MLTAIVRPLSRRVLSDLNAVLLVCPGALQSAVYPNFLLCPSTTPNPASEGSRLSRRYAAKPSRRTTHPGLIEGSLGRAGTKRNKRTKELGKIPFSLDDVFAEEPEEPEEPEVRDEDADITEGIKITSTVKKEILQASSVEEILSATHNWNYLGHAEVSLLFRRITLLLEADDSSSSNLVDDERYFQLLSDANQRVKIFYPPVVTSLLKSLVIQSELVPRLLEKQRFVDVLESFENECCWRFRDMIVSSIIDVLRWYPSTISRPSQTCLREAAINQVDLRWDELDNGAIIDLLFILKDPPESLQSHVDTRITELAGTASIKQLLTILGLVSQGGKASVPLLKSLCYHLSKNEEVFSFAQASKIVFLLASASFVSYPLLEKVCRDLKESKLSEIPNLVDGFHLSSLLASLGKLGWRDPEILDVLCDILLVKCQESDEDAKAMIPTLRNALRALSHVNYSPEAMQRLQPHFVACVEDVFSESDQNVSRIELLWSLTFFRLATPRHVDSVFRSLTNDAASGTSSSSSVEKLPRSTLVKLLQVNANVSLRPAGDHASLSLPSLPVFSPPSTHLADKEENPGRMERFRRDVRQHLPAARVESPPTMKYLLDGPWLHPSGHVIDAIVLTDDRGNTLPIPDAFVESLAAPSLSSISPHLQPGTHAVAVLLFDVFDYTVYAEAMVGEKANASRDLKALGFDPCVVELRQFYREAKNKRTEYLNRVVTGAAEPAF